MNDPTNFSIKKLVEIGVALGMELEVKFKNSVAGQTNYGSTSIPAVQFSKVSEKRFSGKKQE